METSEFPAAHTPGRTARPPLAVSHLLSPRSILANLQVASKVEALAVLAERAADLCGRDPRTIHAALMEREKLGTTGIGSGVAVPHGRLTGLAEPCLVFARLTHPIAFDAIDQQPVDLLFLLLTPEHDGGAHLRMLSRISRLLHEPDMRRKLRATDSTAGLHEMLVERLAA